MNFNTRLLDDVSYSVVSPFDLSSSNESDRNLTPASAGKLVSDALINSNHEAALICVFNAASYNQLAVFLDDVISVFNIEKLKTIKDACLFMDDFEANKRLSLPTIASSVFKTVTVESLNVSNQIFHDVVSDNDVQQELSVDAQAELTVFESDVSTWAAEMQANIATVKTNLAVTANKLMVTGTAGAMAPQIESHCENLPQNTPYTVALCFAGTAAAVGYINTMIAA